MRGGSRPQRRLVADALVAGGIAAVGSGVPSTLHALATGSDPLEATLAIGTLVLPHETRPARLLAAAAVVHLAISLGWAMALAAALPRRRTALWGALAGFGIAALDLGLLGRRLPGIRGLPRSPQIADHLAYGAIVGIVLSRRARAQ